MDNSLLKSVAKDKMQELADKRKFKCLHITASAIFHVCKLNRMSFCESSEIPPDAQYVGFGTDIYTGLIAVYFAHESFDEVPINKPIPVITPPVFKVLDVEEENATGPKEV